MSTDNKGEKNKSRLHVVVPGELPTTLHEYAANPILIGASLQQKLGSGAYWLVANCMYGIVEDGSKDAKLLERTERFVLPVRYVGLREITCQDKQVRMPPIFTSRLAHEDRVAIFGLRQDVIRRSSVLMKQGFGRFSEVGVELDDPVTLLDENEYDIPVEHRI